MEVVLIEIPQRPGIVDIKKHAVRNCGLLFRIGHAIQEVVVINEPQGLDGERRGYIGVVDREQVIAILGFAARRQV